MKDSSSMRESGDWLWTARQRRALAAVVLVALACLFFRARFNPASVPDPPAAVGERAAEVASRIDPNVADWPAFAALPMIGETRARQIVEFRDQWGAGHPGEAPFEKAEDMMRVKGIGRETVRVLEPYLVFPGGGG